MEDYPRNLIEFEARFASEEDCRQYLFRLRWPDGFRCPSCGCGKSWPWRTVLLQCAACGRQTAVTAGTILQGTRSPLPLWFRAMWRVTTQKTAASAWGLPRVLGLNSYETAWTWLHKMRRAMVRPGRDLLAARGAVEESYRLAQQAVAVDPATYKMLVHPAHESKQIPEPQDIGAT